MSRKKSHASKKKQHKPITKKEKNKIEAGKRLYDSIKGKSFFCPLLNSDVRFTNKGWSHLNSNKRNISDVLRRIDLFPYVDSVIKSPTGKIPSRIDENCTIIFGERKIRKNGRITKVTIKVNVIKDKLGGYYFLSIC